MLTYQSANVSELQVRLRDDLGNIVFSETLTDAIQVARFYRMEDLARGEYEFEISTPIPPTRGFRVPHHSYF